VNTQPDFSQFSYICYTFLGGILKPLKVCKSRAGYYVGVQGYSRDSTEYWSSLYEARAAFTAHSWSQKKTP
jgi:hypothetical protein